MAQQTYKMQIQLLSDTLIGAAEGFGAIIDKDSFFDEVGLPIIPGKRVKGVLREQAELLEKMKYPNAEQMGYRYGIGFNSPLSGGELIPKRLEQLGLVEKLFGKAGLTDKNTEYLSMSSFTIYEYEANKAYLNYLIQKKQISRSEVIEYFTTIRMMTKIDENGIAADTSLRTIRVLKKGLIFTGELYFDNSQESVIEQIISLTRRIGSMRNRGFGHIQCKLVAPVINEPETVNE